MTETNRAEINPVSKETQERFDKAMELAELFLQTLDEDMTTAEGRQARFDKLMKYPKFLQIDLANLVVLAWSKKE